ncbi:MAG: radical SAM protein [Ruminococcus sp.]|nr:radical SAM protein [Candidatus Apopatosoma intestinale]
MSAEEPVCSLCAACPRACGVDREKAVGYCLQTSEIRVSRAAPHYWEEPCLSGECGSGTVFFVGCNLRCVYCQNKEISRGKAGKIISPDRLVEIFFELKEKGVHNINLVTPTHFAGQLIPVLQKAKEAGLELPIVYNCGGYEIVETLRRLDGLVDIYLPDFKYMSKARAEKYSHAADYPEVAKKAVAEMVRQTGAPVYGEDGMMKRGTVVRHLVLPGGLLDSKSVLRYLHRTYGDTVVLSIMSQYTPMPDVPFPELARKLTEAEYDEIIRFAVDEGITNAYMQEGEAAEESFIPPFDLTGI